MRETLTALAVLIIGLLTLALIGPAFIDWESRRAGIDAQLTRAAGLPVRSDGAISIRLLPSARVSVETLFIGPDEPDATTARLDGVQTEIALTPLLQGIIRFTDIRIARADVTIAMGQDGSIGLPASQEPRSGHWATIIDRLTLGEGSIRTILENGTRSMTISPVTVVAEAQALQGPWRVQGVFAGLPVRFSTGALDGDGRLRIKGTGGGEELPRIEFDGIAGRAIEGHLKLTMGPPVQPIEKGPPVPVILAGNIKGDVESIEITDTTLDIAEGPTALKFAGSGTLDLRPQPRLHLDLSAKLIDADAFLLSPPGREFLTPGGPGTAGWPIPTDLILRVDNTMLGGEETGALEMGVHVSREGAALRRFSAVLPGQTKVTYAGDAGGGTTVAGRVEMNGQDPERLASFLTQLGGPAVVARLSNGSPFIASANVVVREDLVAASALDWRSGNARLGGNLRYTPAGATGRRGRLEAQLTASAFELTALPSFGGVRQSVTSVDYVLSLDARRLSYRGDVSDGASAVRTRLVADGDGIAIDALEIVDLAGLNATMAGRVAVNGEGTIEGTVNARRIGPLAALAGKIWQGEELVSALPQSVLDAPLQGTARITASGDDAARALTTVFDGLSGAMQVGMSGTFARNTERDLERLSAARLTIAAPQARDLLALAGLGEAGLRDLGAMTGAGEAAIELERMQGIGLTAKVRLEGGGWRIETKKPMALFERGERTQAGEFTVTGADATPWLKMWQLAGPGDTKVRPVALDLTAGPVDDRWRLAPKGKVGSLSLDGSLLFNRAIKSITGQFRIVEGSLPVVAEWAGLATTAPANPGSLWSSARFVPFEPLPFTAEIAVEAAELNLGDGRKARNAKATLALSPELVALRGASLEFDGVKVSGEISVTREGGQANVIGEIAVSDVLALSPAAGTLAGGRLEIRTRIGGSGESPAAIVGNLAGAGQAVWHDFSVGALAPQALSTVAARYVGSSAPLPTPAELSAALRDALDKGPFAGSGTGGSEMPVVLSGGVARIGPVLANTPDARLSGTLSIDLRTGAPDARAALQATSAPPGWIGSPPQIDVAWRTASLAAPPVRQIEPGPLLNGLAATRLNREVEKIEAMEADDRERAFFNRRLRAGRQAPASTQPENQPEPPSTQALPKPVLPPLPLPGPLPITPRP